MSVNGIAPFDVMLGAADNLQSIQIDGEEYTITFDIVSTIDRTVTYNILNINLFGLLLSIT